MLSILSPLGVVRVSFLVDVIIAFEVAACTIPPPICRLVPLLAAELKRLQDFDIDNDGCLGRREFMRVLNLALACETGEDADPSPDYTVGGVLSEQEAAELMSRLDRDRVGKVCWEEFVEYFEGVQRAEGGGSGGGGGPREAWYQQEGEVAEKLLQHMELQGGSTARRAWVSSLRRRFRTADVHESGELERSVLGPCAYSTA